MENKKIIVLGTCMHNTVEKVCHILQSNFPCTLHKSKNIDFLNKSTCNFKADLIIFIIDKNDQKNHLNAIQQFQIPKFFIFCNGSKSHLDIDIPNQIDDFIFTPLIETEIKFRLKRLLAISDEIPSVENLPKTEIEKLCIIGQDPKFLEAIQKISVLANSDASILISGETGTGKSLVASAIHESSKRAEKPFVPVECGAIPIHLLENELFGHQKGAYTDAKTNQFGLVAEAEGGTLFLDEIDSLTLEAQKKLLLLLEEKSFRPLGYSKYIKLDLRILAATNADLIQKVREGKFRKDLYYRLNLTLFLPPLRERKVDIPILADYFLKNFLQEYQLTNKKFSSAALLKLLNYDWPGNIRELENVVQQAVLLSENSLIHPASIRIPNSSDDDHCSGTSYKEEKQKAIEKFEEEYLIRLLMIHKGNISQAAKEARKDRRDFGRLIKKYDINLSHYRHCKLYFDEPTYIS